MSTNDPNETPLTPEQIKNWRKVMFPILGPYALIAPAERIQQLRDDMQRLLDEGTIVMTNPTKQPEGELPLTESEVAELETRRYKAVRSYHSGDDVNWFLSVGIPRLLRSHEQLRASTQPPAPSGPQTCAACNANRAGMAINMKHDHTADCEFPTTTQVAAESDATVTVSESHVDPSLPTHCDHGVSLDDPCEACRNAQPSPQVAAQPARPCPWCVAHPHLQACSPSCEAARSTQSLRRLLK